MTHDTFLRGVNFGGWLILEKWMTPSLFKGTGAIDEYTFMQTSGADEKIDRHRNTFITEDDFRWLQQNGINAVRIPIGYWIFDGDDPYLPAIAYLDWAIKMASKYELRVLIDLHALKGSQNGRDHSGRIGKSEWHKNKAYRQQTIETLERIARRYYNEPAVWGIELINEPKFGLVQWKLRQFYKQAYGRLIAVARPGTAIVFHDAFTPHLLNGVLKVVKEYPVIMDIHWYQFGSMARTWQTVERYFAKVQRRAELLSKLQRKQPIIIGEWSVVLSGEILAGRSKADEQIAFRRHGERQLEAYQNAAGWFYWTYKTEGRGIWHFRSLIEDGVISLK
jgi:glucan 1,3-beta-glucosidase